MVLASVGINIKTLAWEVAQTQKSTLSAIGQVNWERWWENEGVFESIVST